MRDTIDMAREAGAEFAELPMMDAFVFSVDDKHWNSKELERFVALVRADEREACAKRHELAISKLNAELTEVYGLLGMAHLNIQQHLEHGFNKNTAVSTLISVGRYYPRLKAEMEHENDDDL
jgi:hypothetical protein